MPAGTYIDICTATVHSCGILSSRAVVCTPVIYNFPNTGALALLCPAADRSHACCCRCRSDQCAQRHGGRSHLVRLRDNVRVEQRWRRDLLRRSDGARDQLSHRARWQQCRARDQVHCRQPDLELPSRCSSQLCYSCVHFARCRNLLQQSRCNYADLQRLLRGRPLRQQLQYISELHCRMPPRPLLPARQRAANTVCCRSLRRKCRAADVRLLGLVSGIVIA